MRRNGLLAVLLAFSLLTASCQIPGSESETPANSQVSAPIIQARIGFTSAQKQHEHFEKHGAEFGVITEPEYLQQAQFLRDSPVGGSIIEIRREDGVTTRFDRSSGAFLAFNRDLTIRTFFKPDDGERYFIRQANR